MAARRVELTDEAIQALERERHEGENLSEVVCRLAVKRSPLDFVGTWSDMTDEEAARWAAERRESSQRSREKLERLLTKWKG